MGGHAAARVGQARVHAVMLGRGILANLWLIRRTVVRLTAGTRLPDLTWPERVAFRPAARRACARVLRPRNRPAAPAQVRGLGAEGDHPAPRLRDMVQGLSRPRDLDVILEQALQLQR